jgi:hypothetical protein
LENLVAVFLRFKKPLKMAYLFFSASSLEELTERIKDHP